MRFHLVDRISEVVPEKRIEAAKLVSLLDPVLEHHPSAGTILAPSVVLEAMNQTAAWLAMATTDFRKRLVLGALREIAVEGVAPVGERLDIAVEVEDWSDDAVSVNGVVSCRGEPVLRVEGGLCFFIAAAELEDPDLTRQHYQSIHREAAELPDPPPPARPTGAAPVGSPGGYRWVPYDVLETLVPGETAIARKSIVMTDPVFANHFPRAPVLPGVFLLQSMVDVSVALLSASSRPAVSWRLAGIESARFRRRVSPGDLLVIEARLKELGEEGASLACECRLWGEARAVNVRSATFLAQP